MAGTGVIYSMTNIGVKYNRASVGVKYGKYWCPVSCVKYSMTSTECNISVSVLYISTYISCIKSRITVIRHEMMVIKHEISKGLYSHNDKIDVCSKKTVLASIPEHNTE